MRVISEEFLIEIIADQLHDTWCRWMGELYDARKITQETMDHWRDYYRLYYDLAESQKMYYRNEAKRYITKFKKIGIL